MAFFDPKLPIVVRTEASFNEGLSAALFQKTGKGKRGLQPVHFISRTLTDTEKRYSQTEKDALAIFWAKKRFSIYLLGAPRFTIITAHKPLIPMFMKAKELRNGLLKCRTSTLRLYMNQAKMRKTLLTFYQGTHCQRREMTA